MNCETLIRNANVLDGLGNAAELADVAFAGGSILAIEPSLRAKAAKIVEAEGLSLAPGFIDAHTHDDTSVIDTPEMLPKISQGVTTVIVGNCGISASPVRLEADPPDPMNLLGSRERFRYPSFSDYLKALESARPSTNVAALIGHTSLRNNHLDHLDRSATDSEIAAMRAELASALAAGAIGLSTGLAYANANAATTEEVLALAEALIGAHAVYTTHMRTETDAILDAMVEAFRIGDYAQSPVIISHLKCAGIANWGRSPEVLHSLDLARTTQQIGCDCYPYAAGSSTLDLKQVDERVRIEITWSTACPEAAGRTLAQIAADWKLSHLDAARRLQPAGAIYHSIDEHDMRRILAHPATMIGSDGLPWDKHPHPRLWGTYSRVLGRYCREEKLFSLPQAVRKMTSMPAQRFGLAHRGMIAEGYAADLVLFDPATIRDTATFADPIRPAAGIHSVWVNGTLSYTAQGLTGHRAGRFLPRERTEWVQ
ncbi:N-acyl-D-amino-acid deacylase family protein [Occallatibacter savannae]|uniref:N-acyl-D-amino-acid deacylase family protein n=1 Tax=Occallatibacter savannae TaxID=1002691 RepID=UPI000D69112D|nr:D-aminoacylase [Occallatibacter savannae]